MSENLDDPDQRLHDLDARLAAARRRSVTGVSVHEGRAWSVGAEFVGAVLVGCIIGFQLDKWLGTKPWLLFLFLLLGFSTGSWRAYRYGIGESKRTVDKSQSSTKPSGRDGGVSGAEQRDEKNILRD